MTATSNTVARIRKRRGVSMAPCFITSPPRMRIADALYLEGAPSFHMSSGVYWRNGRAR